ncbi:RidA family protein [Myceligenerans indicum]|uniref:RidA family protein n=1 Tax=Myceligenerans indicum TaxID=2593663 RepID=A0ABS1LRF0_9MICO|nr:RidA family protein [Myceligenerans indicum]MBL0888598.1 RidA family protein [Myceligenerans indicum]
MSIIRHNPDNLHQPPGYHHVTVVEPGRVAHLAGQCPLDAEGALVGEADLLTQVDQVVRNATSALSAVGAMPADVVRAVVYVASAERADLAAAWNRFRESALSDALASAATLLGVTCLGYPGQLVEIDLTAALPGPAEPSRARRTGRPET